MPPKQDKAPPGPPFSKDERVLCFHMEMLYEAKIMDVTSADTSGEWLFKIHYKGWKSSWDDWVPQDRIRKYNDENKELAAQLHAQHKLLQTGKVAKSAKKITRGANGSDPSSARGSEERSAQVPTTSGRGRRPRDFEIENEDAFHTRPAVQLQMPDHLKAMLVDDWENVTKNQQLVPLPHPHPVTEFLKDYVAQERTKRPEGSASMEVLEETISGVMEYFDRCLGRILLYRFERHQYLDVHQKWASGDEKCTRASDTYGAEHFCRLLISLPDLIAQTNMDQQSVNRLREELAKITNWLSRNASKYFVSEYETPPQSYLEISRTL